MTRTVALRTCAGAGVARSRRLSAHPVEERMTAIEGITQPVPDETGTADSGGVGIRWQRFGDGERTVLFVPTWNIVDSRSLRHQVDGLRGDVSGDHVRRARVGRERPPRDGLLVRPARRRRDRGAGGDRDDLCRRRHRIARRLRRRTGRGPPTRPRRAAGDDRAGAERGGRRRHGATTTSWSSGIGTRGGSCTARRVGARTTAASSSGSWPRSSRSPARRRRSTSWSRSRSTPTPRC